MATGKLGILSAAILSILVTGQSAHADDSSTQISGFIRSETAINTTGDTDPFNQNGDLYNGKSVTRVSPIYTDTATRPDITDDQKLNMQLFRAELNLKHSFSSDFAFVAHARAIFDPGWYNEYDPNSIGSHSAGGTYGDPNYFKYVTLGNARPNPLEWAGSNYMVDFPALFLEYSHGPLDVRLGNQQIAWGQALFFRVLDVPDGLDFRRHSVIDYASEEYSDKRVPALGLRMSYQMNDSWLLDGYVQKFQPTVYGNTNTPYQGIAAQFRIRDMYALDGDDGKADEGFRIKGTIGDLGVQGIFVHRHNPDGVFAWTQSGVNRDIPGLPGSGQLLACSPFEVDPTGVWSATEWFQYAAMSRLNGVSGLNTAINQFSCSQALGAVAVPNMAYAGAELNQFFQLAGGLLNGQSVSGMRGWISRKYYEENDIGGGLSYTLSGAPGSLTDQLILNWEVMYTPNRTFTSPDLSVDHLRTDEWTTAITAEKYQRFSESFPATYFVAEFMYKSKSDLFGRYLGGMGASVNNLPTGVGGGFKAVAFAFQQPFPNLVWRFDFSLLYDLQGGVLLQPAVRWKPSGKWTVEAFYNYINGHLGGNPNKNIFGNLDYAKEISLRVGYQF